MTSPTTSPPRAVSTLTAPQRFVGHIRYALSGVLGDARTPVEIWATRFHVGAATDVVSLPPETQTENDVTLIKNWFGAPATHISNVATLTNVTISWIGQNGKVPLDGNGAFSQRKYPIAPGIGGGGGTNTNPFQTAAVCSLMSLRAGLTGRGRMFLPVPSLATQANGQVGPIYMQEMADSLTTLFQGINAGYSPGAGNTGKVCIASAGSLKQGLAPANVPVTRVRCGLVLDTMQSRRNKLREAYILAAATL